MSDLSEFFKRIGMSENTQVEQTEKFLRAVHYSAALSIPYENLDILEGKRISLDPEALYEKIVTRRRGGYCFELNAFLENMLEKMGFSVKSCLARFLRGESEIPLRRHRIALVSIESAVFFCDIGIGQIAPREPLLLKEGIVGEQFGESYRFDKDEKLGWVLSDLHKGEWRKFISFTEEKQYEIDYVAPSFYCEMHPDSPFNKKPIVAIKTPNGRKTVDGNVARTFVGDTLIKEEILSPEALAETLLRDFGIALD